MKKLLILAIKWCFYDRIELIMWNIENIIKYYMIIIEKMHCFDANNDIFDAKTCLTNNNNRYALKLILIIDQILLYMLVFIAFDACQFKNMK